MSATLLEVTRQPLPPRTRNPGEDALDEGFDAEGRPRGHYATLFARLGPGRLAAEAERIRSELADRGVSFGGAEPRAFDVDPVPRIITGEEWERVERGLRQRVRALDSFLADVYSERRIVAAGILPGTLVDSADWYEPAMAGAGMPPVRAHVSGPDLVRGADGELRVLEDNLRAPSGLAYALAARVAMTPLIADSGLDPLPLEPAARALGAMLGAAAPGERSDPCVVMLTDGERAGTRYEHLELARLLGLRLATVAELRRSGELLLVRDEAGPGERSVDVIYRRVDDERLTGPGGAPTRLGELLIEPLRAGALACVNSPGSGVGDDKAIHTYVERMIGFYLDEPVLLRSVPGHHLGDPGELAWALPRLGRLVLKPRSEFGGRGVLIGPLAGAAELRRAEQQVRAEPARYVAQEPVALSLHPTLVDGALQGRHVDLRPFVITNGEEVTVAAGGLTRFARGAGVMVVNSGQGGGAKDTWIL